MAKARVQLPEPPEDGSDAPCGFCGRLTYPGLAWPSLEDPNIYLWCCESCENQLSDEDDRIITATVDLDG